MLKITNEIPPNNVYRYTTPKDFLHDPPETNFNRIIKENEM